MERKFTDDEIVKALNCCGSENCRGCPYWDYKCHGGNQMIRDALDLINRQKAEIERLQKHNTKMAHKHYCDGIKEFAERLKKEIRDAYFAYEADSQCEYIDTLVKEMTGENSGN